MKIKELISKIFLILTLFLICSSCTSYAYVPGLPGNDKDDLPNSVKGDTDAESGNLTVQGNDDKGLPALGPGYKPGVELEDGSTTKNIVEQILGILTVIGIITIIISIALIGFNGILASASEKAAGQEKYIGVLVGAGLITSGTIIARIIISVAESIT